MQRIRTAKAALFAATAGMTATLVATAQMQAQTTAAKTISGPPEAAVTPKAASIYDQIWGYTEWYRNEENPVIQSFRFTGRFQLDYAVVGEDDFDDLTIRRFRLGGKATLFHHVTLHTEVDLQPELSPVYQKLTDCYLAWSRNPEFLLTVGKQSAPFTMDGSTSSKELITIDRANLANNLWFPQEYIPGVSASGQPGKWRYFLGLFSSGSADKEFGNFDGGVFVLSTLGYDFAEELKVKKAVLTVNYVYNEHDKDNTFTRSLGDVGSVNFNLDSGKWGFRTDLSGGLGFGGQSDLWGAMLMPYYNITPKLQAVARCTFIKEVSKNNCRISMACAILKAWPSI
jgi:phosphate-selective porin OprO/OprP